VGGEEKIDCEVLTVGAPTGPQRQGRACTELGFSSVRSRGLGEGRLGVSLENDLTGNGKPPLAKKIKREGGGTQHQEGNEGQENFGSKWANPGCSCAWGRAGKGAEHGGAAVGKTKGGGVGMRKRYESLGAGKDKGRVFPKKNGPWQLQGFN